jgi:ubiquitin-conjugating enzyme E2 Q
MPRRAFVADLRKAVEGVSIAGISDVQIGGDDGEFTFQCVADDQMFKISALIPGMFRRPGCETVLTASFASTLPMQSPLTLQ